jgi:hypothetical protein
MITLYGVMMIDVVRFSQPASQRPGIEGVAEDQEVGAANDPSSRAEGGRCMPGAGARYSARWLSQCIHDHVGMGEGR